MAESLELRFAKELHRNHGMTEVQAKELVESVTPQLSEDTVAALVTIETEYKLKSSDIRRKCPFVFEETVFIYRLISTVGFPQSNIANQDYITGSISPFLVDFSSVFLPSDNFGSIASSLEAVSPGDEATVGQHSRFALVNTEHVISQLQNFIGLKPKQSIRDDHDPIHGISLGLEELDRSCCGNFDFPYHRFTYDVNKYSAFYPFYQRKRQAVLDAVTATEGTQALDETTGLHPLLLKIALNGFVNNTSEYLTESMTTVFEESNARDMIQHLSSDSYFSEFCAGKEIFSNEDIIRLLRRSGIVFEQLQPVREAVLNVIEEFTQSILDYVSIAHETRIFATSNARNKRKLDSASEVVVADTSAATDTSGTIIGAETVKIVPETKGSESMNVIDCRDIHKAIAISNRSVARGIVVLPTVYGFGGPANIKYLFSRHLLRIFYDCAAAPSPILSEVAVSIVHDMFVELLSKLLTVADELCHCSPQLFEGEMHKSTYQLFNSSSSPSSAAIGDPINPINCEIWTTKDISTMQPSSSSSNNACNNNVVQVEHIIGAVNVLFAANMAKFAIDLASKNTARCANYVFGANRESQLTIPPELVGFVANYLPNCRCINLQDTAAIFLSSICECTMAEVFSLACNMAHDLQTDVISSRMMLLSIRVDEEINQLFRGCMRDCGGGVMPNIMSAFVLRWNLKTEITSVESNSSSSNSSCDSDIQSKMLRQIQATGPILNPLTGDIVTAFLDREMYDEETNITPYSLINMVIPNMLLFSTTATSPYAAAPGSAPASYCTTKQMRMKYCLDNLDLADKEMVFKYLNDPFTNWKQHLLDIRQEQSSIVPIFSIESVTSFLSHLLSKQKHKEQSKKNKILTLEAVDMIRTMIEYKCIQVCELAMRHAIKSSRIYVTKADIEFAKYALKNA